MLSAWCLDHSKREKERDQVRLERQPDLKPPSVGLYPKDNKKLMGFKCSSFTLIKRFFSSSLLSAIGMVSSTYLRLLIFLPEVLIAACDSCSLVFHMMYSAYKLNKQIVLDI